MARRGRKSIKIIEGTLVPKLDKRGRKELIVWICRDNQD
jgi:hypothetical protein